MIVLIAGIVAVVIGVLLVQRDEADGLELLGILLICLGAILVLIMAVAIPMSIAQVDFFNRQFGTDYTWRDWLINEEVIRQQVEGIKVRL